MRIKTRDMYAIVAGQYGGDFLVFTHDLPINGIYNTIVLPDFTTREIKAEDIESCITLKVLDKVERLKSSVFKDILAEVNYRKELEKKKEIEALNEYHDRREQFTSQDVLDSKEQQEGD